ncbi:MAG: dockerin type I repeat-containing protein, partial [Eubacteriales bacterium]|nr:dockerin type I repeat-containing protein [Eubacteriales bacterium]
EIWFIGGSHLIPREQPADYILGDVNGDGEVSVVDATLVQRHVAKTTVLEGTALLAADVTGEGEVSVVDATVIQRFVAKVIEEF